MLDRIFLAHPRSVGESYGEHLRVAAGFGGAMVVGGAACLLHALLPALFPRTASDTVKRLYGVMRDRQPALRDRPPAFAQPEWQIEYEI